MCSKVKSSFQVLSYLYRCCSSLFCSLAHLAFARSPETNTTRTAAYAAVAAKIASRFALVVTLRPSAKKTMKVMTSAKRALGFVTKYKTTIGQASRNAAIVVLREVTTHETRWFSKCRNLSHSCGDSRCRWSAKQLNSPQRMWYLSRKRPMITQNPRQEIFLDRWPESHEIRLDTEHVPITIVKL